MLQWQSRNHLLNGRHPASLQVLLNSKAGERLTPTQAGSQIQRTQVGGPRLAIHNMSTLEDIE